MTNLLIKNGREPKQLIYTIYKIILQGTRKMALKIFVNIRGLKTSNGINWSINDAPGHI